MAPHAIPILSQRRPTQRPRTKITHCAASPYIKNTSQLPSLFMLPTPKALHGRATLHSVLIAAFGSQNSLNRLIILRKETCSIAKSSPNASASVQGILGRDSRQIVD